MEKEITIKIKQSEFPRLFEMIQKTEPKDLNERLTNAMMIYNNLCAPDEPKTEKFDDPFDFMNQVNDIQDLDYAIEQRNIRRKQIFKSLSEFAKAGVESYFADEDDVDCSFSCSKSNILASLYRSYTEYVSLTEFVADWS